MEVCSGASRILLVEGRGYTAIEFRIRNSGSYFSQISNSGIYSPQFSEKSPPFFIPEYVGVHTKGPKMLYLDKMSTDLADIILN